MANGHVPLEGAVVMPGGQVTSVRRSPQLGAVIGMAWVPAAQATDGATITISDEARTLHGDRHDVAVLRPRGGGAALVSFAFLSPPRPTPSRARRWSARRAPPARASRCATAGTSPSAYAGEAARARGRSASPTLAPAQVRAPARDRAGARACGARRSTATARGSR